MKPSPESASSTRWSRVQPSSAANRAVELGVGGRAGRVGLLEGAQLGLHRLHGGRRRGGRRSGGPAPTRRPRRSGPPGPAGRRSGRGAAGPRRGRARRRRRRSAGASSCRRRSGPTMPTRSPTAIGGVDRVEDHERPDLAGDVREADERHRSGVPRGRRRGRAPAAASPAAARAAPGGSRRRGACARRGPGRRPARPRPASGRASPRPAARPSAGPGPAGARAAARIAAAPGRSAAGSRWHHEQKWVARPPTTIRRIGRPQRGQGSPVRW